MHAIMMIIISMLFTLAGVIIGIATGLVPGIHVNLVATLMLVAFPSMMGVLCGSGGFDIAFALSLSCSLIIGLLITHVIIDIVPSTFLGAPAEGTSLCVYPAHKMLREGRGVTAVWCGVVGSLYGLLISLIVMVPLVFLLLPPVSMYDRIAPYIAYVLLAVLIALLFLEGRGSKSGNRKRAAAVVAIVASGFLGIVVLFGGRIITPDLVPLSPYFFSPESAILLPVFTGLFGLPVLIGNMYEEGVKIPEQMRDVDSRTASRKIFKISTKGTLVGCMMGLLPGISSSAGGVLVGGVEANDEEQSDDASEKFLVAVSAVQMGNAIFNMIALFVLLRTRSGIMGTIETMLGDGLPAWSGTSIPSLFVALLISAVVSCVAASFIAMYLARRASGFLGGLSVSRVSMVVIAILVILVILISGPLGMLILLASACIGFIPIYLGCSRIHLMGVLLVPTMLFLFGVV